MQFRGTHINIFPGMVYCFSGHLKYRYKMILYKNIQNANFFMIVLNLLKRINNLCNMKTFNSVN